ncbi:MAG: hypothetical protein PUH24_05695 [Prevotellaceae bacterium]|nr:hypothetical protein [Prevotella sp.]MDD7257747.1 hypothetical protein [Prevotellaceae bacterium]MDY6130634.1 hypothetical protein [Prevotella sp.]
MKKLILSAISIILLVSCGKQHKATSTVKDFLDKNLVNTDYSTDLMKLDSTHLLTELSIKKMRATAQNDKKFKGNIPYGKNTSDVYIYTRMKLVQDNDTTIRTFYLDHNMTQVVAFKEN